MSFTCGCICIYMRGLTRSWWGYALIKGKAGKKNEIAWVNYVPSVLFDACSHTRNSQEAE